MRERKNIIIGATLITAIVVLVLSTFIIQGVSAGNGDHELEAIRRAVAEKGAQWEAGETSVSRLSKEERRRLLGARPLTPEGAQRGEPEELVDQPSYLDWRNKDRRDWTTPIRDQCSCGSCMAFGGIRP